jgi:hypothetical protein
VSRAVGVVCGGDQQLADGVDPDPGQSDQGERDPTDQFLELVVEPIALSLEFVASGGPRSAGWSWWRRLAGQGLGRMAAHNLTRGLGV